jgi:hypothetical protein
MTQPPSDLRFSAIFATFQRAKIENFSMARPPIGSTGHEAEDRALAAIFFFACKFEPPFVSGALAYLIDRKQEYASYCERAGKIAEEKYRAQFESCRRMVSVLEDWVSDLHAYACGAQA